VGGWQTNNKIQDLLPQGSVDSSTKLVLTDAVYFNAAWGSPFDANNTDDGSFTLLDGSSVTAKFMRSDFYGLQPRRDELRGRIPALRRRQPLAGGGGADAGQFSQVESSLDANTLGTLVAG